MQNISSVGSIPVIQNKRVFVGNLHSSTTEGDLIKVFSKFGTVTDVNYMWHKFGPQRGKPKGFAFVGMSSTEEADLVISRLDGVELKGRRLSVSFSDNEHLVVQTSRGSSYSKGDRGIPSVSIASQALNPTKESGGEQLVRVGEKRGDQSLSHESGKASQAAASDQASKKQLYTVEERMRRLKEALEGAT